MTPSARSANLIAGDGTKNGRSAPNKKPGTNQNDYLTGKAPYKSDELSVGKRRSASPGDCACALRNLIAGDGSSVSRTHARVPTRPGLPSSSLPNQSVPPTFLIKSPAQELGSNPACINASPSGRHLSLSLPHKKPTSSAGREIEMSSSADGSSPTWPIGPCVLRFSQCK